jgi:hypothetical protein
MFFCSLVTTTGDIIKYSYDKTVKNGSGPVLNNVSFTSIAYTPVTESSYLSFTPAAFFSNTTLMRFRPTRLRHLIRSVRIKTRSVQTFTKACKITWL